MVSDSIRKVAIVGGTHGNESIGVYLIKKFDRFPVLLHRESFECSILLANPGAIAENRRYIDRDLNRCFSKDDLANLELTSYEDKRTQEITAQLTDVDFIIDLHSSTANMGLTIIPSSSHPTSLRLAAYLSGIHPDVRVLHGVNCDPMLLSLSPLGCAIEVGAIAQGVLNAKLFQQTEMLVHAILDYLDAMNLGQPLPVPAEVNVFQAFSSIDYPRNSAGEIQAMIHPQLQFQDYQPLHPGDPMFLTFAGETISYQGESSVFPLFINEAAYIEKGVAMTFSTKQQLKIEAI
jgi:succinylglutamate desuccinylase